MCVDNTYFEVYLEKEKALLNENIRIKNRKKKKVMYIVNQNYTLQMYR